MIDIAQEILNNAEGEPRHKALALHAFHVAPHEHALAGMIQHLNLPQDVKADLWDAKRNSVHDPKITKLMQMAHLPKDVLEIAEAHPNTMKLLMEEGKEKGESKGGAAKEKAKPQGSTKEPKVEEKEAQDAGHPSELPPGHAHVRGSDGMELHIPVEHLDTARRIDPNLQILNQSQEQA